MKTRMLHLHEIEQLEKQGCTCANWDQIHVHPDFHPSCIHRTSFSGQITLGKFDKVVILHNQVEAPAGIDNAYIHQSIIGDNCLIRNIHGILSNTTIENNVVIMNCGSICCQPQKSFGKGITTTALNEAGGRSLPIFDRLSSNLAYILIHYRYRENLIAHLQKLIALYNKENSTPQNHIAEGAYITNCPHLENVHIGPFARVDSVTKMEQVTLCSEAIAPAIVESGAILEKSIVGKGSRISNGAIINRCFVGESCQIGNHFSAENSLFFANCEMQNGEAVAAFAGPFTVSHHKTTLLIAAAYSFYNAGSGTNQSNHHYKLGPTHQAIMERGVKTGSNSYILEPAHIGAFTLITGTHKNHPDTTEFPFSYLIERNGESILMPAQNLKSIGLFRDVQKWKTRDKRTHSDVLDLLDINAISPLTVCKMKKAIVTLETLKQKSAAEIFSYNGFKLMRNSIDRTIATYQTAITDYATAQLVQAIEKGYYPNWPEFQIEANEDWVDLGGAISPRSKVEELSLTMERCTSIDQVEKAIQQLHKNNPRYVLQWSLQQLGDLETIEGANPDALCNIIDQWIAIQNDMRKAILSDAAKEFSARMNTSYGIDAITDEKWNEYAIVKGTLESHPSVKECNLYFDQRIEMGMQAKRRLTETK